MEKIQLYYDHALMLNWIGVSCHRREFWLAFNINQVLSFNLTRIPGMEVQQTGIAEPAVFPLYYDHDGEKNISYFLLSNRSLQRLLFTGLGNVDFFLLVNGMADKKHLNVLIKQLKTIPNVVFSFLVDTAPLKKLPEFIDQFELHITRINSNYKNPDTAGIG